MAYFLSKSKEASQPQSAYMQGIDSLEPQYGDDPGFVRRLSSGHDTGEPLTAEELELLQEAEEIASVQLSIALIFVSLLVGVLLKLCTKKLKIPYTPVLTVVGLIFGLLDRFVFK